MNVYYIYEAKDRRIYNIFMDYGCFECNFYFSALIFKINIC